MWMANIELVVEDWTMFQILLVAGSVAVHRLNKIGLLSLFKRSGQILVCSGLFSIAKRLIDSVLLEQGIIRYKQSYGGKFSAHCGHKQAVSNTTEIPALGMYPGMCSFGKQHLPSIANVKTSDICIMDLPQNCDCSCAGFGRCITEKRLVPLNITINCHLEQREYKNNFQITKEMMAKFASTDIAIDMASTCEYTKDKDKAVDLPSSDNSLTTGVPCPGSVCLPVSETVILSSSMTTENCGLVSQLACISTVGECDITPFDSFHTVWGSGQTGATRMEGDTSLLPISNCVYDMQGRLISMTVNLESPDSDCCCSSSDGETEDVFDLYWQPGESDNEYLENEHLFNCDNCSSDDSDVFIAFEDPDVVPITCGDVALFIGLSKVEHCHGNRLKDTSKCFDNSSIDEDQEYPKKRVSFKSDSDLVEVHHMFAWDFAYHSARKGQWERDAADRAHFKQRIMELEPILTPVIQSHINRELIK